MKPKIKSYNVFIIAGILTFSVNLYAQVSGNIAYDNSYRNNYLTSGTNHQVYLTDSTMLVEARVLLNELAEEFVAVFGVSEEAKTITDCNNNIDKRINGFVSELNKLGIAQEDYYIDFISQNRVFDFEVSDNIAREKLAGFELQKNISVHFKDRGLIHKLPEIASKFEIYDLIKVDYIKSDIQHLKKKLFDEAMRIITEKKNIYISHTNLKLESHSQIYYENYVCLTPSDLYSSYMAYSSEKVKPNYITVEERKMQTFYFRSVDQRNYDLIINPVIIEPVIQYSYTLQVKYDIVK